MTSTEWLAELQMKCDNVVHSNRELIEHIDRIEYLSDIQGKDVLAGVDAVMREELMNMHTKVSNLETEPSTPQIKPNEIPSYYMGTIQ